MAFAQQLSAVLTAHCDVLQQHKLQGYLRSVQQWLPRIEAFCDLKSAHPGHSTPAMAGTPGAPPTHSSAAEGGDEDRRRMSVKTSSARMSISGHDATTGGADASAQDRATLRRHTQLVKQIMALLQRNAVAVFSDCTKDLKPVLEICEITSGDTSVVVLSQISKFCNRLSQGMEALAGVANKRCTYDVATNQLTYAAGGEEADVIYGEGGGVGSAPVSPGGPSTKGPTPTAAASPPAEISAAPADSAGKLVFFAYSAKASCYPKVRVVPVVAGINRITGSAALSVWLCTLLCILSSCCSSAFTLLPSRSALLHIL
jgi:hypothetical protein